MQGKKLTPAEQKRVQAAAKVMPIRAVARVVGVARNTVRKYIRK